MVPLGMELGLGPGDIVLDGDPAPPPKTGTTPPTFRQCLLWPNGWKDQVATPPRQHCTQLIRLFS